MLGITYRADLNNSSILELLLKNRKHHHRKHSRGVLSTHNTSSATGPEAKAETGSSSGHMAQRPVPMARTQSFDLEAVVRDL